jgi:hypothetical protein
MCVRGIFAHGQASLGWDTIDGSDLIAPQNHHLCNFLEQGGVDIGCPLLIGMIQGTGNQSGQMVHRDSSCRIEIKGWLGQPGIYRFGYCQLNAMMSLFFSKWGRDAFFSRTFIPSLEEIAQKKFVCGESSSRKENKLTIPGEAG